MPRPAKRPRLWLRAARRDHAGNLTAKATWFILDRGRHIATGCAASETREADQALQAYIADKYQARRTARGADAVDVADVLAIYDDDVGHRNSDPAKFDGRLKRLALFWAGRTLSEVTGATCREYAEQRGAPAAARRELEDLRSAINHHAKRGFHRDVVKVALPPKGRPRDRWLTRDEAARLLWVCWRYRERQTLHRGAMKGMVVQTDKRPLRHLVRFILIALYTGTRAGAVATASPTRTEGRSFVDLERGVFHRLAIGRPETNKRQPPVRLPPRLLAHLRRWARIEPNLQYFVEWHGKPVKSIKTGFATAVRLAAIDQKDGPVSPHTFRHTAATWLMRAGVPIWEAAGFLGMSEKTLRDVYGHHHPDHQKRAADAIGYRPRSGVSLAISLAQRTAAKARMAEVLGGPGRTRTSNQIVMSDRL